MIGVGTDLLLTLIVYLSYPIIYRIIRGRVTKNQGKKMALWNSIIGAIIFMIMRSIFTPGQSVVTSFAPALFYYYIARLILIDKNKEAINESIVNEVAKDEQEK